MNVLPAVRNASAAMFAAIDSLTPGRENGGERDQEGPGVTAATRSQPGWAQVEILWQDLDAVLSELRGEMDALYIALDDLEQAGVPNYEGLVMEIANRRQTARRSEAAPGGVRTAAQERRNILGHA